MVGEAAGAGSAGAAPDGRRHDAATVSLGVQPHITSRTMGVGEVARLVADHGLASLYVCEHTHIPVDSRSLSPRGILPEWCKYIPDPYVTLAAVAAATDLEIGTAVGLPAQHDPVILAKTIATLDQLVGGRFVFGVGWGWNREEFIDHTGAPTNRRVAVLKDKLALMRAIWADEEAEYDGTYARVSRSWSWPKPTRPSGPPVLIGCTATQRNFDRVAEWADGWIPMAMSLTADEADTFAGQLADLRRTWAEAGRDPDQLDIAVLHPPTDAEDVARALDLADRLGVGRVVIQVSEELVDSLEEILARVAPALDGR